MENVTNVAKPESLATVRLSGTDGNVYALIGRCAEAGRRAKYTPEQLRAFKQEALNAASYDEAIRVMMTWFDVE